MSAAASTAPGEDEPPCSDRPAHLKEVPLLVLRLPTDGDGRPEERAGEVGTLPGFGIADHFPVRVAGETDAAADPFAANHLRVHVEVEPGQQTSTRVERVAARDGILGVGTQAALSF